MRLDLICPAGLMRLAAIYKEGSDNYGPTNYCRGIVPSNILGHMMHHYCKYMAHDRTEDHLAKIAWACFTLMHYDSLCQHHETTHDLVTMYEKYMAGPAEYFTEDKTNEERVKPGGADIPSKYRGHAIPPAEE